MNGSAAGQLTLEPLRQLAQVETEIQSLDKQFATRAFEHPQVKLLTTPPGVDYTIRRMCLLGLRRCGAPCRCRPRCCPFLFWSPPRISRGPLLSRPHHQTRFQPRLLAAHPSGAACKRLPRAARCFLSPDNEKRKNRKLAVVATAPKLVSIAWHMLKNKICIATRSPKQSWPN